MCAGSGERRIIVALVYGFVCIVGMLAALFPVACSGVFGMRRAAEDPERLKGRATKVLGVSLLHGHHPLGPEAVTHELRIKDKSYCASCSGLLSGALLSLAFVAVFALSAWPGWTDRCLVYVLYGVGVAGVLMGMVQALVLKPGARIRFVLATVFVVGTSLMLVATDLLTADLTADLFVVLLAVFWLLSRISLSHRD